MCKRINGRGKVGRTGRLGIANDLMHYKKTWIWINVNAGEDPGYRIMISKLQKYISIRTSYLTIPRRAISSVPNPWSFSPALQFMLVQVLYIPFRKLWFSLFFLHSVDIAGKANIYSRLVIFSNCHDHWRGIAGGGLPLSPAAFVLLNGRGCILGKVA